MIYAVEMTIVSILTVVQVYLLYYVISCFIQSGLDIKYRIKYLCAMGLLAFAGTTAFSFYLTFYMRKIYIYAEIKPKFFSLAAIIGTLICILMSILLYFGDKKRRKNQLRMNAIQFAVDNVEQGICIYREKDGMAILMNRSMYELMHRIFHKTMMDGRIFWEELHGISEQFGLSDTVKNSIYVRAEGKKVYRFTRNQIESNNQIYMEILSADVTEIVEVSRKLYSDNLKLKEQFEQTSDLVKRKRSLERKEEILLQKVQIHRKLGECIIATRNAMKQSEKIGVDTLMGLWEDTIKGIEMNGLGGDSMDYRENMRELHDVAQIMGCEIVVENPNGIKIEEFSAKIQESYTDLIREALCNAVRHGKANKLFIQLSKTELGVGIRIADNGRCEKSGITEGGGLKNLRVLLKNVGMDLKIQTGEGHMVLESEIP